MWSLIIIHAARMQRFSKGESGRSDADDMEEAITQFLDGLEEQERRGFKGLHRFIGRLSLPLEKESRGISHSEALKGGFLPAMDAEEQKVPQFDTKGLAVRTFASTLSLRDSSRKHGGRSPPYPVVSGRKRDSNLVQQSLTSTVSTGFRLPFGVR
jgi:hypothetical protein